MQLITPDLNEWMVASKATGASFETLLSQMKSFGWPESLAAQALRDTPSRKAAREVETLPIRSSAVPDPTLDDSPTSLVVGGSAIRILVSMRSPRIVVFGNLLSAEECEELIELAAPRLDRSTVVDNATGSNQIHAARTSDSMFFEPAEYPLIRKIEERIAALVMWPIEKGEGLQVLRYGKGTQYEPHYDYFLPEAAGTPVILSRGGQRVASLVMYLNTPDKGGGTIFPDLQFEVAPQRGNAVFFSYDRPHSSTRTLHGGAPVIAGEKWVATKWLREEKFVL